MRKIILSLAVCAVLLPLSLHAQSEIPRASETTIQLMRKFSKDLLDRNAVPYMQPLVTSINATSNSRFFNQAKVPAKVDKPYFRLGVHAMIGFIGDDQKTYKPSVPMTERLDTTGIVLRFASGDTAGAAYELMKNLLYRSRDAIREPAAAATIFGNLNTTINLPGARIHEELVKDPLFQFLKQSSPATAAQIETAVLNLRNPQDTTKDIEYPLPAGQNMNTLMAFVPQLEVGSLWGTEALIRFIPPVKLDTNIGKFSFWGFGLKHSITQYFENPVFDAAIQAVYQGTSLVKDNIGETGASLKADGTIWNVNLQASKNISGWFDIFSGLSFEYTEIQSDYTYYLPIQIQHQLGMIPNDKIPTAEKPGDTDPQHSTPLFTDRNYKFVVGIARQFGPIAIFADYNISKFNIFSAGIEARF